MSARKFKNIIWDWNGTLLDDISICLKSMNTLLTERKLPELTEERYQQVFTFPVRVYYEQIGFDFTTEDFDIPALKFIENYKKNLPTVKLFPEVESTLNDLKSKCYTQWILSAMEENSLKKSVGDLHIHQHFIEIAGIQDHFAHSKIERGIKLLDENAINKNETLMVGDTLHDLEVAEALGISCVLISQGHQAKERLEVNGNRVLKNLTQLARIL